MPIGKISLWAGESGVGKSRLCIDVAKNFTTMYTDGKVLYFQTESPLSDFASWANDTSQYNDIFCSGEDRIDEMIKIIYQVKPHVVFIDSVNEIEEFETGTKREARRLIKGIDGKPGLKKVASDTGAHIILLGQINQDGKTIKGGTSLPHLVDIALNVVKTENFRTTGIFRVEKGVKHRYGSGATTALFKHTDTGVVEYVTPAPVVYVEPKVDPDDLPANYFGEQALTEPAYVAQLSGGSKLWTVRDQKKYLQMKVRKIASGEIKVDRDNNIIPTSEQGLLRKLNKCVGNMFGLEV
jgi:predicted ATP-dependent serine protease